MIFTVKASIVLLSSISSEEEASSVFWAFLDIFQKYPFSHIPVLEEQATVHRYPFSINKRPVLTVTSFSKSKRPFVFEEQATVHSYLLPLNKRSYFGEVQCKTLISSHSRSIPNLCPSSTLVIISEYHTLMNICTRDTNISAPSWVLLLLLQTLKLSPPSPTPL